MASLLEFSQDGMVRRMPEPLNYGSFRSGADIGSGSDRPGYAE